MKNRKNKFLHFPEIAGGKESLKKYFEENLVYPEEARLKGIEGIVLLMVEIDDNGTIIQIEVIKGLQGGCNDEAIRLIKNIKFGGVKNKGLRLKTKKRFKIRFQLPEENTITYHYKNKSEDPPKPEPSNNYSYTIQIK